ncbi:antibiotic biosynthesis monooxygenase family protein [Actinomadura bangladeshensis]|uniref:Antibiotic biosynthesis monooxygenase n=1 Tax=Actinomadura bangladeshensis TaxID=453573 RepID=A0A4V2XLZ2_9ACTN|nr:antibiotic biosynthesis monooxygenase family protein [Actinomadura bangladeshensis]TDC12316.1 antibiotic biosynthesis monooxygenase [Actinomadura bangladeshensis]
MIAITRYRVPGEDAGGFAEAMTAVLAALAASPGFRSGRLARTVDDPDLWALVTEWDGAGHYRRALGAHDLRLQLMPQAVWAIDEPGAYEIVASA